AEVEFLVVSQPSTQSIGTPLRPCPRRLLAALAAILSLTGAASSARPARPPPPPALAASVTESPAAVGTAAQLIEQVGLHVAPQPVRGRRSRRGRSRAPARRQSAVAPAERHHHPAHLR